MSERVEVLSVGVYFKEESKVKRLRVGRLGVGRLRVGRLGVGRLGVGWILCELCVAIF
jgi:uncharacterized protein YaiL (DUF2058 family)